MPAKKKPRPRPHQTKIATRRPRAKKAEATRHPLDAIFRPRSIAVIGASRRKQTIGREILHNLVDFEFTGPCYPINPVSPVVNSIRAYRKLSDVPGPVDLAVIVVPSAGVMKVIDECGRKGVKGIVVITAGFKEVGEEGNLLEQKLQQKIRRYGMRMVGPNCMGVINTEPGVRLNATFAAARRAGRGDPRRRSGEWHGRVHVRVDGKQDGHIRQRRAGVLGEQRRRPGDPDVPRVVR
jgi:predicted CoA-binding protein